VPQFYFGCVCGFFAFIGGHFGWVVPGWSGSDCGRGFVCVVGFLSSFCVVFFSFFVFFFWAQLSTKRQETLVQQEMPLSRHVDKVRLMSKCRPRIEGR